MFKAFIQYPVRKERIKDSLSEINTADAFFDVSEKWDGTVDVTYHINLIDLFDQVFVEGGFHPLSIEQTRILKKYLNEAGRITKNIEEHKQQKEKNPSLPDKTYEEFTTDLDDVLKQLDEFLGSYYGVNNGQFAG